MLRDETAKGATLHVDETAWPRTLADYNCPDRFYTNRSAIRPPTIQKDFELKPQYYTHPTMGYLTIILWIICRGSRISYLLLKSRESLKTTSLAGDASHGLKQLPPWSLTSWSDIKNAFLCNFFDEAHAEDLRSKIATFTQEPAESFRSSWIRFNSYQRDCPHHGFNDLQLLSTFYRGIVVLYQMALDASSNRNSNTMNPEEAVKVIENLASSSSTKNTDFERKRSATILGNDQMDEVKANLDSVHKLLR